MKQRKTAVTDWLLISSSPFAAGEEGENYSWMKVEEKNNVLNWILF
jgi:hypothetical protein